MTNNGITNCIKCNNGSVYSKKMCRKCYRLQQHLESPLIECHCGCKMMIHKLGTDERIRKFVRGHHVIGDKNPRYNGYKSIDNDGYRLLYKPDHLNSRKWGWILEHRYIVSKYLGRPLKKDELIHHINENRLDNRLSNLMIMTRQEHQHHHISVDISDRFCSKCGSNETRSTKNKYKQWFIYEGGFQCSKCYNKCYYEKRKE